MLLRLNIVLLLVTVVSALLLVRQSHDGRKLFADLERARAEGRKLDADIHRLKAEREGEATNLRVEQLARERLQMRPISPALTLGPAAAASVAAAAASAARPASGAAR
ncbi:cell division protein FtsL [Inhella sp.]|uniref:cell division protein FtsL n=1 Tax=Inhella sp. TaxID=1921806 RepID=UPI0035B4BA16